VLFFLVTRRVSRMNGSVSSHAAAQGYGLLQLGWAVFVISLGPAVLFWIYFNKPELL